MIVFKILGVILLIFLLISFLRVGAIVRFGEELSAQLRVGPVKLTVYPKKAKKEKKKTEPEKREEKAKKPAGEKKKRKLPKPTLEELFDALQTALSALKKTLWRLCKRLRIDPLDMSLFFGGNDPACVAETFGIANSLMWTIMPKVEELFYVPDPSLHLRMDFDAPHTRARGMVGVSVRICDLFAIVFTLAIPMLKWFLRFKKAHKDEGTMHKGKPARSGEKDTKETDRQINDLTA